jgi:hypothetical protein
MEDKRGIKHSHSPSVEGSPSSSDAKPTPLTPSRSPPPPGSPSEISSHHPGSPVFEQGGLWWSIYLHLQMRRISSLLLLMTLSSPKDSLVSSTALSQADLSLNLLAMCLRGKGHATSEDHIDLPHLLIFIRGIHPVMFTLTGIMRCWHCWRQHLLPIQKGFTLFQIVS